MTNELFPAEWAHKMYWDSLRARAGTDSPLLLWLTPDLPRTTPLALHLANVAEAKRAYESIRDSEVPEWAVEEQPDPYQT